REEFADLVGELGMGPGVLGQAGALALAIAFQERLGETLQRVACRRVAGGHGRNSFVPPGMAPRISRSWAAMAAELAWGEASRSWETSRTLKPRWVRWMALSFMPAIQRSQRKKGISARSAYRGRAAIASRKSSWRTSEGSTRPLSRRSRRRAIILLRRGRCRSRRRAHASWSPPTPTRT